MGHVQKLYNRVEEGQIIIMFNKGEMKGFKEQQEHVRLRIEWTVLMLIEEGVLLCTPPQLPVGPTCPSP